MSITQETNRYNELVIIDSEIADVNAILDGLTENQTAVLLSDGTGIDELLNYLEKTGLDWNAMHFVTHGCAGSFSLNGDTVSLKNFDADKWARLGSSLSDDGDILFYGCSITASDDGRKLVDALATATGADIAASDDVTGIGGDWILETQVGAIGTAPLLLNNCAESLYDGRLKISSSESVEMSDQDFSNNTFEGDGGAVDNNHGTFTAISSTFSENTAGRNGGAVYNSGTFTANDSYFSENIANIGGGAVYNSGTFTANDSYFSENSADNSGGAVYNIKEFKATGGTFDNNGAKLGGAVDNCGNSMFTVQSSTFSNNNASSYGGAVFNSGTFTANDSYFSENSADNGGGAVYNNGDGTFTASGCSFSGNIANRGGAIYQMSSSSSLTITDSSFLTASDTIIIDGGSVTFGGKISLAGNLTSKVSINVLEDTEIIFDVSSYTEENEVAIITDLDKILKPDCGATYSVNIDANQAYGKYLLATGCNTDKTIFLICGDIEPQKLEPNKPFLINGKFFTVSRDNSTKNLYLFVETPPAPEISFTVTPEAWSTTAVTLSATFTTPVEGLTITSKEYSYDNKTWTNYTDALTVEKNKTIYFRATDSAGTTTEKSFEIRNVTETDPTPKITVSAGEEKTFDKNMYDVQSFDVKKEATVTAYGLKMQKGSAKLTIADNATMTMSELLAHDEEGSFTTVALKKNVSWTVSGAAQGIVKLSAGDGSKVTIEGTLDGTKKATSVSFGKDSTVNLKDVDLKEGKNSFTLGSASTATVTGSIDKVNKLTLSNGIAAKKDIAQKYTTLITKNITGSIFNDTLSFGNDTNVSIINGISLNQDGSDAVKIGKNSTFETVFIMFDNDATSKNSFTLGSASTATIGSNISNVNKLTLANGIAENPGKTKQQRTIFTAGGRITGSIFNDTLSFGNDTEVSVNLDIDLNQYGNDTVKIGKNSSFKSGRILFSSNAKSKNTFSLGTASTATITGDITNVNKLTLANGIAENPGKTKQQRTILTAQNISGSAFNDTLSFGNDTSVTLKGSINLSAGGSDTVKIGKNSTFNAGIIQFSSNAKSKNTFSLGTASTATIGAGIMNVNKLTLANGIAGKPGKSEQQRTTLTTGNISGSAFNDTLSFGNDTEVKITGSLDFNQDGSDTLKIGKNSTFEVNFIAFNNGATSKNSFTLGTASTAIIKNEILNVNKLTIDNGVAAKKNIAQKCTRLESLGGIAGSIFDDTMSFGNDTFVSLLGNINLTQYGNDTVKIGKNSTLTTNGSSILFCGDATSKNTFSLGTASTATVNNITNVNKLTLSNGIAAKKDIAQKCTTLTAEGSISGSVSNDTLSFGNDTEVKITGSLDFTQDGSDSVKIGKNSTFEADFITFSNSAESKNSFTLGTASTATIQNEIMFVNKLTLANGIAGKPGKSEQQRTKLETFSGIFGSRFNDTFSFGNDTEVSLQGDIDLYNDGSDTVKIGKNSTLTTNGNSILFCSDATSKNTFSLGTASTATVYDITNVNKLTLSNGVAAKKDIAQKRTTLTAEGSISGSVSNDTMSFGNDTLVKVGNSLTLGDGDDKISFGNFAEAEIGSLDFGEGEKDTLTIGKESHIKVDNLNVDSLEKLTIGKNSTLEIADSTSLDAAKEKWSKYADQIVAWDKKS